MNASEKPYWVMPVRQTQSGFTLIELLVVVAVIALLLGILLPALHKARLRAGETTCASNLRQVNLAVLMYAQDDGAGRYPLEPTEHNPHPGLLTRLRAYDSDGLMKAFYCPLAYYSEPFAQNPTDHVPVGGIDSVIDTPENRELGNITYIYWSFEANKREADGKAWRDPVFFYPRALRVGGLRWLAQAADEDHPLPHAQPADRWVVSDFWRKKAPFPHGRKGGAQEGGVNVTFLDGHVDRVFRRPRDSWR